jgi:hypothetical protein
MFCGTNLADLKDRGLKLDVLRTKSGKNLLAEGGGSACKLQRLHGEGDRHFFVFTCPTAITPPADAKPRGIFGLFKGPEPDRGALAPDVDLAGLELDGLEIAGTLTVIAADGTETLTTEVLDLTKKSDKKIRLAGYEIALNGESAADGLFDAIGTAFGQDPDRKLLGIALEGKIDEIAEIHVVSAGKPLSSQAYERFGDRAGYSYVKEGDGRGAIEIERWTNLHDVAVPFELRIAPERRDEPKPPRDELAKAYTAELVRIKAARAEPAPVKLAGESSFTPPPRAAGFDMKFLVRGPNIVEIESFQRSVDVLRTKDGRDLRLRDGNINYQIHSHSHHHFGETPKHHFFELQSDEPLFGELDGLEVRGTVKVVTAEGRTEIASEPIDFTKPGTIKLGDWTIPYRLEEGSRPTWRSSPERDENGKMIAPSGQSVEPFAELELQPTGENDRIIEVDILVDGEPVQSRGYSSGGSFAPVAEAFAPVVTAITSSLEAAAAPAGVAATPLPPVAAPVTSTLPAGVTPPGYAPTAPASAASGPAVVVPAGAASTALPPGASAPVVAASGKAVPVATVPSAAVPSAAVPSAAVPSAAVPSAAVPVAPGSYTTTPAPAGPNGAPSTSTLPGTAPAVADGPQPFTPIMPTLPRGGFAILPGNSPTAANRVSTSTYRFDKPKGKGVVKITYWKVRREVSVPFSHNLPKDDEG